jgi:hypothetical protein
MKKNTGFLKAAGIGLLYGSFLLGCTSKNNTAPKMSAEKLATVVPVTAAISSFVHPGIINTKESLDFIRTDAIAGNAIRLSGNQVLTDFTDANPMPASFPAVVYVKGGGGTPTEDQIRKDAILAYAWALRWAKTGNNTYQENAKAILNGWAGHFQRYDVVSGTSVAQTWLEAAWVAPSFAAAAEIIRYYKVNGTDGAAWASSDIDAFDDFLNNLKNNYVNKLVDDVDAGGNTNNWGVSAGYAKMAMGVFLNSSSTYEDGKRIILKLLPVNINSSTGEVLELCSRDCTHPQYTMCGFTYAAEIARIQGDNSLYEARSKSIRNGWKWIEGIYEGGGCRNCSSQVIQPAVEVAFNYYQSDLVGALRNRQAPYGVKSDNTFLGFTTYTHYAIGTN